MNKSIMIIDAYNMIHRCRFQWGGGKALGENQIIFNLLRTLKATIAQFQPDKVYFPLDGRPTNRLESYPEYKGNRREEIVDPDEVAYWDDFRRQKRVIIDFVKSNLPVVTVFHPEYECDDLVLHIIDNDHPDDDILIVSSDTDFIQILNKHPNRVQLYNPVNSSYRKNTDYDYISWKAMVGDKADNIPGVRGIGKKTAQKILSTEGELEKRMENNKFMSEYNMSYNLIKLHSVDEDGLEYFTGNYRDEEILSFFAQAGFESMLKEKYYTGFKNTFVKLNNEGE